jgi:hypothetical protein
MDVNMARELLTRTFGPDTARRRKREEELLGRGKVYMMLEEIDYKICETCLVCAMPRCAIDQLTYEEAVQVANLYRMRGFKTWVEPFKGKKLAVWDGVTGQTVWKPLNYEMWFAYIDWDRDHNARL